MHHRQITTCRLVGRQPGGDVIDAVQVAGTVGLQLRHPPVDLAGQEAFRVGQPRQRRGLPVDFVQADQGVDQPLPDRMVRLRLRGKGFG